MSFTDPANPPPNVTPNSMPSMSSPSASGGGVGKTLFNAAIADLLSLHFGSMMLWALEDNPNRGFYQHLGGHKTRSRGLDIGGNPMSEVAYVWPELSTP